MEPSYVIPLARRIRDILLVAVFYVAAARVGQFVAIAPGNVTPVWIPSGIILAAVLIRGYHVWPGIFLGAVAGNAWAYLDASSFATVTACALCATANGVGDVLSAVVGAFLIRRAAGSGDLLASATGVVRFLAYGAFLGPGLSALFGVTSLAIAGELSWARGLVTWWTGHSVGVVLVTPLLLAWTAPARKPRRLLECLAFVVILLVTVAYCLLDSSPTNRLHPQMAMAVPILVWGVFRFDRRVWLTAILAVAAMAVVATASGRGPFAPNGPTWPGVDKQLVALVQLQLFMAVAMITLLVLSGVISEGERSRSVLRRSEARFRRLIETAPDAMVIVNQAGSIVLANAQAEKIFGYSREDLVGQRVELLIPERFRQRHVAQRAEFNGDPAPRPCTRDQSLPRSGRTAASFRPRST